MRTGADTRLMPTLVAMGALYDSAVAASESIYGLGELEVVSDDSVAKKKNLTCY